MTSGNEHQYLQGDGSASSPARNGFCFRLMHLALQAPRMPAQPRIHLKRTPHALSGQCRLLAALLGRSCSSWWPFIGLKQALRLRTSRS